MMLLLGGLGWRKCLRDTSGQTNLLIDCNNKVSNCGCLLGSILRARAISTDCLFRSVPQTVQNGLEQSVPASREANSRGKLHNRCSP